VFMEKPVTVDGPTTRKMLQLAEDSLTKNLKVGVGLMIRHCKDARNSRNGSRAVRSEICSCSGLIACTGRVAMRVPGRKHE